MLNHNQSDDARLPILRARAERQGLAMYHGNGTSEPEYLLAKDDWFQELPDLDAVARWLDASGGVPR